MEAVKFLNDNAFATPAWAIDPEILRRIEPIGALSRVRNAQTSVLTNLLSSARFARLVEQEAIDGSGGLRAGRISGRRPQRRVEGAGLAPGEDRRVPARICSTPIWIW